MVTDPDGLNDSESVRFLISDASSRKVIVSENFDGGTIEGFDEVIHQRRKLENHRVGVI